MVKPKIQHHYNTISLADNRMKRPFRVAASIILGAFLLLPLCTAASMEPFKAEYKVSLGGLSLGSAKMELRRGQEGHFVFEKQAKANGLARMFISDSIFERSEWRLVDGRPTAVRFESSEVDGEELKHELILFDRANNRALTTWQQQTREIEVPEGAVDRLTLEMRMMMDARAHVGVFEYPLVERGKLKQRRFVPEGKEKLEIPVGTFNTVKYRLVRRDNDKRSTLFWLARELGYLAVRMEHHDKGHGFVIALELSRIHPSISQTQ
ncbi:MAG: DUF3108 domain-containing protein [Gammaproteobacteria bacterium]|nr:DUF3108 domain-containing protein [Gammaproteobacteria bacterium]